MSSIEQSGPVPPHLRDVEYDSNALIDIRHPHIASLTPTSPPSSSSASEWNRSEIRDYVLRSTLIGLGSGLAAGFGYAAFTACPLQRALTSMSLNGALIAFTFSGLSVSLAHHSCYDRHTLPNHLVSGALSGSAIYPLLCAKDGLIRDVRSAQRFTAKGAAGGMIGSVLVYGISAFLTRRPSEPSTGSSSWLPSWAPVRRSTEADLAAAESKQRQREARHREQQEFQQMQFPPPSDIKH